MPRWEGNIEMNFKKINWWDWDCVVCRKIEANENSCDEENKFTVISWLTERPLASAKGFCCMELEIC
jgi:uncharacterized protein YggL (DUF469 family)